MHRRMHTHLHSRTPQHISSHDDDSVGRGTQHSQTTGSMYPPGPVVHHPQPGPPGWHEKKGTSAGSGNVFGSLKSSNIAEARHKYDNLHACNFRRRQLSYFCAGTCMHMTRPLAAAPKRRCCLS